MSRVHTAMRRLEQRNVQETGPEAGLSNLVGALLEELADEVPEQACLETVRADLLAASGSYEAGDKKELAIRFYLAIRSLLREHALVQERLRQAESSKMNLAPEFGQVASAAFPAQ